MTLLIIGLLTVLIPVGLVLRLVYRRSPSRLEWLIGLALAGSVVWLLFQLAPWAITSYYLRYAAIAVFLAGAIFSYLRHRKIPWLSSLRPGRVALAGLAAAGVAGLNAAALVGKQPPAEFANLEFPLRDGTYYVLQGGTTFAVNPFHSLIPAGRFALDIVQVGRFGNRATGIFPPLELAQYRIYGADLHSPCSGTVKRAVGAVPDNVPPRVNREQSAGNYIVIACDGLEVALLHMKQHSLRVAPGERVRAGQPLGQVGNSGYSDEPHLHVQANAADGRSVPILFDGRFLSINDLYLR